MDILIDPSRETFLADHQVGGSAVLPTVLGLDLVVRAAAGVTRSAVEITQVRLGAPIRFRDDTAELTSTELIRTEPTGWTGTVRTGTVRTGQNSPHLVAVLRPITGALTPPACHRCAGRDGPAGRAAWAIAAHQVYPPYFHGPTFRVIAEAEVDGDAVFARLAADLPALAWSFGAVQYPARLLELVLQTCGVWHLADSGRMMIPSGIGSVRWTPAAHLAAAGSVVAHVSVDPGPAAPERTLSGHVCVDGVPVLAVRGYRTTDLGVAADPAASRRLRRPQPTDLQGAPR